MGLQTAAPAMLARAEGFHGDSHRPHLTGLAPLQVLIGGLVPCTPTAVTTTALVCTTGGILGTAMAEYWLSTSLPPASADFWALPPGGLAGFAEACGCYHARRSHVRLAGMHSQCCFSHRASYLHHAFIVTAWSCLGLLPTRHPAQRSPAWSRS